MKILKKTFRLFAAMLLVIALAISAAACKNDDKTGGNNVGGITGGENPGGNPGGENPGGNPGGENPGGNPGGSTTPAEKVYVTVYLNGGQSEGAVDGKKVYEVEKGNTIPVMSNPTKEGWLFGGFFYDNETFQKRYIRGTTVINENLSLYVKWDEKTSGNFTVTFDSRNGDTAIVQTVAGGDVVTKPKNPENPGKLFVGWYTDSACNNLYDFTLPVTGNLSLYAKWDTLAEGLIAVNGYNEGLYATWKEGAPSSAEVYYKSTSQNNWTKADNQLIRTVESGVARVDVLGLKAEDYNIKIVTSTNNQIEVSSPISVAAHDRSGYAHFNYSDGIGAYNDDGSLKDNALVIYVTESNKNDVTGFAYKNTPTGLVKEDISDYIKPSTGGENYGGIGYILNNRGYASNTEREKYGIQKLAFTYGAVDIRILGTVTAEQKSDGTSTLRGLTDYNSTGNGGSTGDNGRMARITNAKNLTIEGIGEDACIYGWGVHFVSNDNLHKYEGSGKSFEVRNITFNKYPEDAIGMEGTQGTKVDANGSITSGASSADADLISPVERCWIHNNVFLPGYCANPAESDKKEGDGSCDFKRGQYYTLSYNYFEYCHKTNLIGSSDNSLTYNITMHHNWWNNCGSRMPLLRRANCHFYNNYVSGDSNDAKAALSYVTSARANSYMFNEANYYDGCKQVFDIDGGVVKSFNNTFYACFDKNTLYDASTRAQTRTTPVSNNCKFIYRNIDYSHFDTDPTLFYYDAAAGKSDCLLDDAVTARVRVMQNAGVLGFGRADTAINAYTPSNAVQVNDEGETTIALPTAKNDVDVNGVMFRNLTGASSGTIKGKGQIITFTLSTETELKFTATAVGHAAAELVGASGKVYANKVTGDYTITLQAGTYFIASGQKDKEVTISRLVFESTGTSSVEHINTVNAAIDAIPDGTLTLANADAVQNAHMLFNGMSNNLKTTYISEQSARYDKLNNAVEQIKSLRVKQVQDIIDQIGVVDANSYDRIAAAREAYDALGHFEDGGTATLQNRVSAEHLKKLTDAEEAFAAFEVQNVINMINSLPAVPSSGTRAEIESIINKYDAADNAYKNLPDEKKSQVTNLNKLTEGNTALLQFSYLFDFQDALAAADETNVTLAEGKALKDKYDRLS
ncbi:MAG: InlB B-repeat-containing protein, partial [Clostridia bacterium]|nr:InlB B-repeat-containing protein [Clostridia bacterium]